MDAPTCEHSLEVLKAALAMWAVVTHRQLGYSPPATAREALRNAHRITGTFEELILAERLKAGADGIRRVFESARALTACLKKVWRSSTDAQKRELALDDLTDQERAQAQTISGIEDRDEAWVQALVLRVMGEVARKEGRTFAHFFLDWTAEKIEVRAGG